MKRIIVLSCLVLVGASANCQNKKTKKQAPKTETEVLAPPVVAETPQAQVSAPATPVAPVAAPITEAQKAKLKEINKVFKTEKSRIESDTTLNADQKAAQIKVASKEKSKKIKENFTPEQIQAMKDAQKAKKEASGGGE
jgi:predicted transglutaminase-like cysteine proteinase